MKHLVTLAAALIASGTLAGTAEAQSGGYYRAVPATQPAKASFITRSTMWRLQGGTLVAGQAPERDMIVCQLVAKRAGALTSFSAGGKAYDVAALDQCNGKQKVAKPEVAAAASQGAGR